MCYRLYSTVYYDTCTTVCTSLCLWLHLCCRVYSTVSMVAHVLPYVQHCVYGFTCATACTALCLWWYLCYRVYSTVSMVVYMLLCVHYCVMVEPVLPYVQHCVEGGTCATVCTTLCLWWHLCHPVLVTFSMSYKQSFLLIVRKKYL